MGSTEAQHVRARSEAKLPAPHHHSKKKRHKSADSLTKLLEE